MALQDKPATEFHRSKSYKDGLFGQCKACCARAAARRTKPLVAAPTVVQKVTPPSSCSDRGMLAILCNAGAHACVGVLPATDMPLGPLKAAWSSLCVVAATAYCGARLC